MNLIVFIAAMLLSVAQARDVFPVLGFYPNSLSIGQQYITLGQIADPDTTFIKYLKLATSTGNTVNVIVVDDGKLTGENLKPLFANPENDLTNVKYQPLVQSPYESLNDYVANSVDSANVNVIVLTSVSDAFKQFLANKETSVPTFLIGKLSDKAHSRHKRQTTSGAASNTSYVVAGVQCVATFTDIYVTDMTGSSKVNNELPVATTSFTCNDNTTATLIVTFGQNNGINNNMITQINLTFTPTTSGLYWVMNSAVLVLASNNNSVPMTYYGSTYALATPTGYSFACTRTRFQPYNSSLSTSPNIQASLYIDNFQMQPFNTAVNTTSATFGQVNYCQGFFSEGIWMAISASLLLLLILSLGVSMLLSIRTMDRFDDPKGKPLAVALEK
jgi:hypothetical protein